MENKVLVDTNILLDYFLKREPFFQHAKKIIALCKSEKIHGCIASHSISNMFYILRKEYSSKERRILLMDLCSIFEVVGIDKDKLTENIIVFSTMLVYNTIRKAVNQRWVDT